MLKNEHKPVLLQEVIKNLNFTQYPNEVFIDATFGRGGHSREILRHLSPVGRLLAIDKDLTAVLAAEQVNDPRFTLQHGSFTFLKNFVVELGLKGLVSGILLDLGVSSPQLDNAERGFSFMQDGPLDMRMDTTQKMTAASWLQSAKEEEMASVFYKYGEERFSRRIAHAIALERAENPITTTGHLAAIVSKAHPRWEKHKHPATRVFQALRIFINNELEELKICLEQSLEVLAVGGRLLVITFHSLEDHVVKDFLKKNSGAMSLPARLPITQAEMPKALIKRINKISPSVEEIRTNPRARSAKLFVMEKLAC